MKEAIVTRLTNRDYLTHRHRLMDIWEFDSDQFAELQYFEQMDLHRFFAISKDMYDDEAIKYRKLVTDLEPSLPNQAGRAYAKFWRVLELRAENEFSEASAYKAVAPRSQRKHNITVKSVANPKPDVKKLAEALWRFALQDAKESIRRDDADVIR